MHPIQLFNNWYNNELSRSDMRIPSACCLSTTGLDGYPNARFVSLKEVKDDSFVVTGPLRSRKGQEIIESNKVALTFWWACTQRQVRIQGDAILITALLADRYFHERSRESQIVSVISEQGKEISSIELLDQKYKEAELYYAGKEIEKPVNWGGYFIKPVRMEFMEFRATRFHLRRLFQLDNEKWTEKLLQP